MVGTTPYFYTPSHYWSCGQHMGCSNTAVLLAAYSDSPCLPNLGRSFPSVLGPCEPFVVRPPFYRKSCCPSSASFKPLVVYCLALSRHFAVHFKRVILPTCRENKQSSIAKSSHGVKTLFFPLHFFTKFEQRVIFFRFSDCAF